MLPFIFILWLIEALYANDTITCRDGLSKFLILLLTLLSRKPVLRPHSLVFIVKLNKTSLKIDMLFRKLAPVTSNYNKHSNLCKLALLVAWVPSLKYLCNLLGSFNGCWHNLFCIRYRRNITIHIFTRLIGSYS